MQLKLTGAILAGGQSRRMGGRPKALLPYDGQTIIARQIAEMRKICCEIIVVTALPEILDALRDEAAGEGAGSASPSLLPGSGSAAGVPADDRPASALASRTPSPAAAPIRAMAAPCLAGPAPGPGPVAASGAPVRFAADRFPGRGPLAGIHAALAGAGAGDVESDDVWVVACDMPHISAAAAAAMLERKRQTAGCDAIVPLIEGQLHPLHGIYSRRLAAVALQLLERDDLRMQSFARQVSLVTVEETFFQEKGIDLRFVDNLNTPEEYEASLG